MKAINYHEVFMKAGVNWNIYHGRTGRYFPKNSNGLVKFLGTNPMHCQWHPDYRRGNKPRLVAVPDECFEKFMLLASPHFHTLLKAYEAKYGPLVYDIEQHTEQSS